MRADTVRCEPSAPFNTAMVRTLEEDPGTSLVRIDALRCFPEVVRSLGGDPEALLRTARVEPDLLPNRQAVLPYRTLVNLLERCARDLGLPDFGMRLAQAQGGAKVLGPLEVAMCNSPSLAEAFRYCSDHIQAYSPATQIGLESEPGGSRSFLRFEILLPSLPFQSQAAEHALLLTQHAAQIMSCGQAIANEVWFTHEPNLPLQVYRKYFNANVRFGQAANGLFFETGDLDRAIPDPDNLLYDMATTFIDKHFPATEASMTSRVRSLVGRMLAAGECTNLTVAAELGMHPRTMQRRLREEKACFEAIKDGVRKEIALHCLRCKDIPLIRVAERLGYSEQSVLSRSCYRWFAASPRELRNHLLRQGARGM